MATVNFTTEANGYSIEEVDKYIEMIQQEYANAIAWGEENERKFEQLKSEMQELGVYFTIEENNHSEVIEKVFEELSKTVAKIKVDADKRANEIIEAAHEKSKGIVRQAMEKSVELRTDNTTVMKNLKSINDMINVILEKNAY